MMGKRLKDGPRAAPLQKESDSPLVSVLTPVLDEERCLGDSIAHMQAQTIADAEFLIIDGGSSDRTLEIASAAACADARIRLLTNPSRRTPNGLNIGLREARGTYVARMDAHTHYPATYLADGVARLQAGDVHWASGPALPIGTDAGSRRTALALSTRLGVGGASFRLLHPGEVEVDSGFTGVWEKSFLELLGGWDEAWPVNQDGEMAARVRELGCRIVCLPSMAAQYVPRSSIRELAAQYWGYGVYKAKTCKRHPASMRRSHVLPPALLGVGVAAIVPTRHGKVARLGLATYGALLGAASQRVARNSPVLDRLGVMMSLAVMHTAWGTGFVVGCWRFGVPWKALSQLVRRK
jgi:hypothetical protein